MNKVIWVTGASSGIGEAVCIEYAKRGYQLILSARRDDELNRVKDLLISLTGETDNYYVLPMDLTDYETMPKAVDEAFDAFGRIDVLYNNAGISQRSLFHETTMETFRTLFEIDVFAQIALTQQVLPKMIKQGGGHLAVTASVAGKVGVPLRTGYCAVKHAMMGFFDALRAETVDDNIQVSCVVPGFIKTNIAENALAGDGSPFGQSDAMIENGMPADAAAKVIVSGLEKGKKEINVGQGSEMKILAIKRFFPNLAFKITAGLGMPQK